MAGELFKMLTGIKMVHLPYRGESLAMTDLLGGQVQVVFATTGSAIAYVKAGTVRALAVTTPTAHRRAAGRAADWRNTCRASRQAAGAACARRRTRPPTSSRSSTRRSTRRLPIPRSSSGSLDLGGAAAGGSPADFAKFIADETENWAKVVKFAGIKTE